MLFYAAGRGTEDLGSGRRLSREGVRRLGRLMERLLACFAILRKEELASLVDDHLEMKLLDPRRYKLDKELQETWSKY